MGEQYTSDVSCEEALIAIMDTLLIEGLAMFQDLEDIVNIIEDQLRLNKRSEEDKNKLILYHSLIWRTAGDQSWTLPRSVGQCRVLPYMPKLLLATQMKMSAEKVIIGEYLAFEEQTMCGQLAMHLNRCCSDPDLWTEVSLLEFITGCSTKEHLYRSQAVVKVNVCKDRSLTWRDAQDSDRLKGEDLFVSELDRDSSDEEEQTYYARSDSDVRKLYECRPRGLKNMVLGQFASSYRKLAQSDNSFEAAKEMIDPETGLGPLSTEIIAGTQDLYAPRCFQLKNEVIMQMRSEKKAVLQLLESGNSGRYANQLLWQPWKILEQVSGRQVSEETELQKNARLAVYPMSVFPKIEDREDSQ